MMNLRTTKNVLKKSKSPLTPYRYAPCCTLCVKGQKSINYHEKINFTIALNLNPYGF